MHRPQCSCYIQAVWWLLSTLIQVMKSSLSSHSLVNNTLGQGLFLCDLWVCLPAGLLPFDLSMGQGQQRWGEAGGKEGHQKANDLQTGPALQNSPGHLFSFEYRSQASFSVSLSPVPLFKSSPKLNFHAKVKAGFNSTQVAAAAS